MQTEDSRPRALRLTLMAEEFAVCRLAPDAPLPGWLAAAGFVSVTRTTDELSIVCPAVSVPEPILKERGWRLWRVQGPFPFTATGVLSSLLEPLAAAGIPVLAIATFDTDYLLIQTGHIGATRQAWLAAGHTLDSG